MNAKTDDLITRFLLGELSDEERAEVEERFLADNDFFEAVLSAEDALIDQYLLGELSDDQRERAEKLFQSSPWQRSEVSFTEELIASVRQPDRGGGQTARPAGPSANAVRPEEAVAVGGVTADSDPEDSAGPLPLPPAVIKNFTPRFSWAAVFVLLLVCLALVSWLIYYYSQRPRWQPVVQQNTPEPPGKLSEEHRGEVGSSGTPESTPEKDVTPEEVVVPQPKRKQDTVASVLLTPTALGRSGGSNTVRIKTATSRVHLQLEVDEAQRYGRYSVLVTTFEGQKVWSRDALDAGQIRKGRLTLTLPSSLLTYNDYRVELKGLPEGGEPVHIADYVFKVRD
jgi:hypothetical protein